MTIKLSTLFAALALALAGNAWAVTQAEYNAQKAAISSQYKAAKASCDSLKANARDVCLTEARGVEKIGRAEAESAYNPSARNTENLAMTKAEATYDTAVEKCDDLSGNAKDVCVKDAKAAQVKATNDAKVSSNSSNNTTGRPDILAGGKRTGITEERQANYQAANERCDTLSGNIREACQRDAKVRYGMN